MNLESKKSTLKTHRYLLNSTPQSIAEVERIVQDICEKYNVPEDIFGNILITLTEAVSNAIYHGNQSNLSKKVTIEFVPNDKNFIFRVTDEGNGFNYHSLPDPTLPENISKIGGRGIFIIHRLSDSVKFENEGRTIEIHFHIPSFAASNVE